VRAPAVVSRHPVEMRARQSYEAARAWAPLPGETFNRTGDGTLRAGRDRL